MKFLSCLKSSSRERESIAMKRNGLEKMVAGYTFLRPYLRSGTMKGKSSVLRPSVAISLRSARSRRSFVPTPVRWKRFTPSGKKWAELSPSTW